MVSVWISGCYNRDQEWHVYTGKKKHQNVKAVKEHLICKVVVIQVVRHCLTRYIHIHSKESRNPEAEVLKTFVVIEKMVVGSKAEEMCTFLLRCH